MEDKFPTDQTTCIDDCICPYCGYRFDGKKATNNDLDVRYVHCPKCRKEMHVFPSVEWMCTIIDE